MANQETTFEVRGTAYTVRFTHNALYRLQKTLGRPLSEVASHAGPEEIACLLWAGLEGGRLKSMGWKTAFTLAKVGQIVRRIGLDKAASVVLEALQLVMPEIESDEESTEGMAAQNPTQAAI